MLKMNWLTQIFSVVLCLWLCQVQPAIASIHTYPEGQNRVMFRSLQTVRDRADQAWQLVLFKRVNGVRTESIHLRIVGFPGQTQFIHPSGLKIATSTAAAIAQDALPNPSPFPANVGEYDLQDWMMHLTSNSPLHLQLPTPKPEVELVIPPFIVKEWREVSNKTE
jgi:Protein of unknown function (DUF3122)